MKKPNFKLANINKQIYDKVKIIQESFKADFYAPLEYIAKHTYARALLTNLFNTPMDECLKQEILIDSVVVNSSNNFKFLMAAKQLDDLVALGAAEKNDGTLNQRYTITLKGHDAMVTYQNLFDSAQKIAKSKKDARKLVVRWLEAAVNNN